MQNKNLFSYLTLLIFAVGCQSAAVSETPTPTVTAVITPTNTMIVEDDGPRHSVATCRPLDTEEEDYTLASDWITGAEDYSVTIIEYGDYQ